MPIARGIHDDLVKEAISAKGVQTALQNFRIKLPAYRKALWANMQAHPQAWALGAGATLLGGLLATAHGRPVYYGPGITLDPREQAAISRRVPGKPYFTAYPTMV